MSKNNFLVLIVSIAVVFLILSSSSSMSLNQTSLAAFNFQIDNYLAGKPTSISGLALIIATFLVALAIPVAVLIIIYAGFLMLTSGGNPERYKKGLTALRLAVLGLAIILIGRGFVSLIQSLLSVK